MKICRLIIKKFRTIEFADIWCGSLNAIVGQNNVGKSCLLRALNSFFNYELEKESFELGVHSYAPRAVSKIEIHFTDCDREAIPDKYISSQGKIVVELSVSLTNTRCTKKVKYKNSNWVTDATIIDEIKKQVDFILIPPNRDVNSFEFVEKNVLRLLVEQKMQTATEARDNYTVKFQNAVKYLEEHALRKISTDAKELFPIKHSLGFSIEYMRDISYKDYLNDISIIINEKGRSHPLQECGSGIQSLSIIALYNLLGKEKDKDIIIGLEEPETNLHPQAQKELIDYFKGLIKSGSILQFFFTTHSSQIIDQIDHTDIILFKKKENSSRGFSSVVRRLPENFFDMYKLDDFKYYQFYRYRNSEFFFASHVVVTESKNEIEIIKKIGSKYDKDYEINGLSYLNLEGVGKAKYTIHLLNELDIPFLLIVDKDFFVDYVNSKYHDSLNSQGFPKYKNFYRDPDLINKIIPKSKDRDEILKCVNGKHTRMLEILNKYNIISMRFSLDVDLVCSKKAREKYFDLLSIPEAERSIQALTERRKGIKKIQRMIEVFE